MIELGSFRLRDGVATQPIVRLGDGDHPPLRTLDSQREDLPRQLTGLIGPGAKLTALDGALGTSAVTTLGPGGIGKVDVPCCRCRSMRPVTVATT